MAGKVVELENLSHPTRFTLRMKMRLSSVDADHPITVTTSGFEMTISCTVAPGSSVSTPTGTSAHPKDPGGTIRQDRSATHIAEYRDRPYTLGSHTLDYGEARCHDCCQYRYRARAFSSRGPETYL